MTTQLLCNNVHSKNHFSPRPLYVMSSLRTVGSGYETSPYLVGRSPTFAYWRQYAKVGLRPTSPYPRPRGRWGVRMVEINAQLENGMIRRKQSMRSM